MSATVDERVVEMQFNNKQFEQNANQSIKTLDKLNASLDLKGSSEGFDMLNKSIKSIDLSNINGAMDAVTNKISIIGTIGDQVIRNLTNKAIDFGTRWVKSLSIDQINAGFQKYASKTESVQTIMNATGKSIDEVSSVIEKLNQYTDETSYNFTEMVSSVGKFTSAGIDLDVAEKAMEGIANWAAKAGVGTDKAGGAFYNLSQAIGSGALKMQDWKSIENLNMATLDVKNQFIEAGLAAGTLVKQYDKVVTANGRMEVTAVNFRDSLQKGWINSDVLISTMEKYADRTTEFGLAAFHAAQEAKTFKDAIDATKDAVSTGWMNIFEQIFGNYEEARVLWTNVANELIEAFTAPTTALFELMKGWHEKGGYVAFVESLTNAWTGLKSIVSEVGEVFGEFFPALKVDTLVSFTEKIRDLTKAFKESVTRKTIEDFIPDPDRLEQLQKKGTDLSEFYDEIEAHNKEVDDTLSPLRDTLSGIFSVIKLIKTAVSAAYKLATPFIKLLTPISRLVSVAAAGLGQLATKAVDAILNSEELATVFGYLKRAADGISRIIGIVVDDFSDFIKGLKDLPAVKEFSSLLSGMWESFTKLAGPYISNAKKKIEGFLESLEGVDKASIYGFINKIAGYLTTFVRSIINVGKAIYEYLAPKITAFWQFLQPIFSWIGAQLGGIFTWVSEFVKTKEFQTIKNDVTDILGKIGEKLGELGKKLIDFIREGGLAGVFQWLKQTLEDVWNWIKNLNWSETIETVFSGAKLGTVLLTAIAIYRASKMFKAASGFFSSFASGFLAPLKAFAKGLALRRAATSVLMLAGSLYILSKVPIEDIWKLIGAVGALAGIMALLYGAMTAVTMFSTSLKLVNNKAMLTSAAAMIVMASAIFILAKSAKVLGDIQADRLQDVMVWLVGLMLSMTLATIALGNVGHGVLLLGIGLISIVAAVSLVLLSLDKLREYIASMKIDLSKDVILKAGFILGEIAIAMIGIGLALKKLSSSAWQTAAVILATGVAVYLLSVSITKLLGTDIKSLWTLIEVLVLVVGAMAGLALVSKLFPADGGKRLLGLAGALAGLGIAVLLFSSAISWLGKMDPEVTKKGLQDLAEIMKMIGLVMVATSFSKTGNGAFIGLAIAIIAIVAVLKYLSTQDFSSFMVAATMLGSVMTALGISLALGGRALSKGNFGTMIGAALIAVGIAAALWLLAKYTKSADLIVATGALGAALISLGVSMRIGGASLAKQNWSAILSSVVMIIVVAAALGVLAQFSFGKILGSAIALGIVLEVLAHSMTVLAGGTKLMNWKQFGVIATTMTATLLLVVGALWALSGISWNTLLASATAISMVIITLAGSMSLMSHFKMNMTKGDIGKTIALMAGMLLVAGSALWLLAKAFEGKDTSVLMDLALSISTLMAAMAAITAAVGAIGNSVKPSKALSGILDVAVVIGGLLLIIGALKAIDWAISQLGGDTISGINRVGDIFMAIGEAVGNLIGGIGLGISDALPGIAQNVSGFCTMIAPGLMLLSSIKINESAMKGLSSLAGAILKLTANDILNGLTEWLTGGSSITKFAEDLVVLGPALASFGGSLHGVSTRKISQAAEAIQSLVNVANSLENVGGLLQKVTGTPKSLAEFATELGQMVADESGGEGGLLKFAKEAPKIAQYKDAFGDVATALQGMVDVANAIDPTSSLKLGDWAAYEQHRESLKTFADGLPSIGGAMSQFYTNVKNLPEDFNAKASNVTKAIDGLVDVANKLQPETTSIFGSSTPQSLTEFLSGFSEASAGINDFFAVFTSPVLIGISDATTALDGLVEVSKSFAQDAIATSIRTFSDNLYFAADNFEKASVKFKNTDFDYIGSALIELNNYINENVDFNLIGKNVGIGMLSSMEDAVDENVGDTASVIGEKVNSALKNAADLYEVGRMAVIGFVNGALSVVSDGRVTSAGLTVGNTFAQAVGESLVVKSPSRRLMEIGSYAGEGFIIGVKRWFDKAGQAGANLAESTVDAASLALDYVHELMSGDMDVDMTIRPVMDLTDVNAGMNTINSLFSQRQAIMAQLDTEAMDNSSDIDELLDVGWKILKEIQNGSDLYLDDKVLAGRINRRLGQA